ncbi:DUF4062 domain-containing protein [Sphingomonas sp. BT-65]|uniref:DUF4062 domain-containing protein n=1 Tax=Sphingomonas sp. BT-65 TaxID=2989821 RepID=UPI00223595FC|nr:DUF4062 domain-containing protein [Sphingomonas sp. BT-65]MCW4461878.1 DUF4062 domain-containing protein [Sphingomonas sp. BT-65]
MQKKFQVFVSSTFRDLADERQDAIRSILDLGHIPAGMELFPASDTEQLSYIKKVIDECDYYILIMGGRYGSLDDQGISFTEREYDYAVESGKVVLAFVHGNTDSIPVGKSDISQRLIENLNEFRAKVMSGRLVREWQSREQLEALVVKSLVRAISDYPATGWVRGDAVASEELLGQVNDLRIENDHLRSENISLRSSLQPSMSDLADLSEDFTLRFYRNYRYNGHSRTEDKEFSLTWKEIFIAIGITIASPKSVDTIKYTMKDHLKENKETSYDWYIYDSDKAVVKNQLVALGLIKAYVSKTLNSGALHEFMQLTDMGKKLLSENLAVRSKA